MTAIYESFELGLGSDWQIRSLDPDARVAVRDLAAERIIEGGTSASFVDGGNNHALAFDSVSSPSDSSGDLGIAIWSVDLSGFDRAILTFQHYESGDEDDPLPERHTTETAGDGVSISIDGTTWYQLRDLDGETLNRSGDGLWELVEIDLLSEINRINAKYSTANLSLDGPIQLKWSHYDDGTLADGDGWAIDEIRITDASPTFSTDFPTGAFYRFGLSGVSEDDYYFRAAVFGEVGPDTPILVSVHGSSTAYDYDSLARSWHRFIDDPANGIDSLIVVTPVFVPGGKYEDPEGFGRLSWNPETDAAADLALVRTLDEIAATGIGDSSAAYLWGFSEGGQFVSRFTAAHPDKVAAAVIGAPSSHVFPSDAAAWPYGFGESSLAPAPDGVELDIDAYLSNRIMIWVGENDDDPNASNLDTGAAISTLLGEDRLERAINQFSALYAASESRDIPSGLSELELYVAAERGHSWSQDDLAPIYEFLFRDRMSGGEPVVVIPRLVLEPTDGEARVSLPSSVTQLDAGEHFYIEFWVAAPGDGSLGIQSGQLDLFVDESVAAIDGPGIEHSTLFDIATGHTQEGSFLRNFAGSTDESGVGVDGYALFGRVSLVATADVSEPTQLALALMRSAQLDFTLEDGSSRRTDFAPFEKTILGSADTKLQGTVFNDVNGNGVQDADEPGIAGAFVELFADGDNALVLSRGIEPDDFESGAFLNRISPWVELSAVGGGVTNPVVRAKDKGAADASTGSSVFGSYSVDGLSTTWVSGARSLRIDFKVPVLSVAIDVIGNSSNDIGRLDAYDSAGNRIGSVTTGTLGDGDAETLTIRHPEIAFVIASGDVNHTVRLDNLAFEVVPTALTDDNGGYRFEDLDAGSVTVTTQSDSGVLSQGITITGGDVAEGPDFGLRTPVATDEPPISVPDPTTNPDTGTSTDTGGDTSTTTTADPTTADPTPDPSGTPTTETSPPTPGLPEPPFFKAINVGGDSYLAKDGTVFEADPGISDGSAYFRSGDGKKVSGTVDDKLFSSMAAGEFSYDIAVPHDGDYAVTLLFTEAWARKAGQRVFDVNLEDETIGSFDDIDVFADTGGRWKALTLSETVHVSDGVLDIDLVSVTGNAILSGIEVNELFV